MKKIKIFYFGSSNYSFLLLKNFLKKKEIDVVGVCAIKKKFFWDDEADFINFARKKNIPCKKWSKNNLLKLIYWIKAKKPDYIFCIGWPYLLPPKILNLSKYFSVGFHPTDIPNNRGRHPLIWSIILNLKKIYPSFFILTKETDFGPIISKKEILIKRNSTSTSLYSLMIKKIDKQVNEIIKNLKKYNNLNINTWLNKNRKKKGNILRKRNYNDGLIDWRMSSENIKNLVNALKEPYPCASFIFKNKEYKLMKVKVSKCKQKIEPGKIVSIKNNKPIIKTGDHAIQLIDYKPKIKFKENDYIL